MSYLQRLKLLKTPAWGTDETDEIALLSVLAVPDRPHSENIQPLTVAEIKELTDLITGCVNPDEIEELLDLAIRNGAPSLEVYRGIHSNNSDKQDTKPYGGKRNEEK
ncbi:MAG: hypothetical protein KBF29_07895 [Sterolibacterium sp.]|nr:hypothetical protein [Sterolibacterium sp.]